jgi:hypothetical protein
MHSVRMRVPARLARASSIDHAAAHSTSAATLYSCQRGELAKRPARSQTACTRHTGMLHAAWLWALGLALLQRTSKADTSNAVGAAGRNTGGSAAGGCAAAMMQSTCGGEAPAECDVCAGQKQHLLRSAGCSAAEVSAWCTGLPVGATELFVVEGRLQPGGQYVGMHTSQLQALIDGSFAPKSGADWRDMSLVNSSVLRHLHLQGAYLADVSLSLPSLFVLKLSGSITPASNLSRVNTSRYQALVQMADVHFAAVIGGTFDGSMLPAMPSTYDPVTKTTTRHGYMALSIQGGGNNAIRGVRAMSNNSDSVIGVNMSPRAEIGNCEVGGDAGALGVLKTRCIWTLATSHALVHDCHVHHCSSHSLDFDAYTSNSVAWNNLCEDNGEEGK